MCPSSQTTALFRERDEHIHLYGTTRYAFRWMGLRLRGTDVSQFSGEPNILQAVALTAPPSRTMMPPRSNHTPQFMGVGCVYPAHGRLRATACRVPRAPMRGCADGPLEGTRSSLRGRRPLTPLRRRPTTTMHPEHREMSGGDGARSEKARGTTGGEAQRRSGTGGDVADCCECADAGLLT